MTPELNDHGKLSLPIQPKATVTDAPEDASPTTDTSPQDAVQEQGKKDPFKGRGGAYAAKVRWEKERARQALAAEQAEHQARGIVIVVRTSVPMGEIISKLSALAKKGDVAAARELRAYLAEAEREQDTDLSHLDARTLQALKARLLQEIADEEGLDTYQATETIQVGVDESSEVGLEGVPPPQS